MSAFNVTLKDEYDNVGYPLTTASQVKIRDDGTRLPGDKLVTFYPDESGGESPALINADTLSGHYANEFVLKSENRKWYKLGPFTGAVSVDIKDIVSICDELLFIGTIPYGGTNYHDYQITVPSSRLNASSHRYITGYSDGLMCFDATRTSVIMAYAAMASGDYTGSTVWEVYYR